MKKRVLAALFALTFTLTACVTAQTSAAAEAEITNEAEAENEMESDTASEAVVKLRAGESTTIDGITYTAGKKKAAMRYVKDSSTAEQPFIVMTTGEISCQISGSQSVIVAYKDTEFDWYTNATEIKPVKGTLDVTLTADVANNSGNTVTFNNKESAEIAGITYSYSGSKALALSFGMNMDFTTTAVSGQLSVSAPDNYSNKLNEFCFTETGKPAFTLKFHKYGAELASGAVLINTPDVPSVLIKANGVAITSNYAAVRIGSKNAVVEGSATLTDKKGKTYEIYGNYDSSDEPYGKAKISTSGTVKIVCGAVEEEVAEAPETENAEKTNITYTVKKGDTLYAIAKKYGTTVSKIVAANKARIKNPNFIQIGWKLNIPQS